MSARLLGLGTDGGVVSYGSDDESIILDESNTDASVNIRRLIYLADGVGGPFEGFLSGAFRAFLPEASPFPTSVTWYVNSTKTKRIVEKTITRNPNQTPSTIIWKLYASDGSTVLRTVTDTITYLGVFEIDRTRTWT